MTTLLPSPLNGEALTPEALRHLYAWARADGDALTLWTLRHGTPDRLAHLLDAVDDAHLLAVAHAGAGWAEEMGHGG